MHLCFCYHIHFSWCPFAIILKEFSLSLLKSMVESAEQGFYKSVRSEYFSMTCNGNRFDDIWLGYHSLNELKV